MKADQVIAFLDGQRYCAIATIGPAAEPHLVPVSFVSLDDGSFWLPAVAGAARLRDIWSRPRAALVVGQGVGTGHTLVLANGSVETVAPDRLPDEVRQRGLDKLGNTEWAACWLVLRPDRLIAYAGHADS
jgi:hypothetical protein